MKTNEKIFSKEKSNSNLKKLTKKVTETVALVSMYKIEDLNERDPTTVCKKVIYSAG